MKKSVGAKTLILPTPVWCVCSYDKNEKPNVMTIAWGGICCSSPPCVTISLRKATYTYGNIMERQAYTVSVPSEKYCKEVDYFGIVSGKDVDKFKKTGLTPIKSDLVNAPYIEEFPLALECKVIHHYEIGLHTQFIGEILDVKIETCVLTEDGKADVETVRPFIFNPDLRNYYGIGNYIGDAFGIGKNYQ